jgi:hypothetical protein
MTQPHGRLVVNPNNPDASAQCDRCSVFINRSRLSFQYEWAGNQLINLNFLFCPRCLDEPQPQLKGRNIPPDPLPVLNARPSTLDVPDT